jgi:prepilin-type processing-associated H-X9-DG protein
MTTCQNNFKELTQAWSIYSNDNKEHLVNNDTQGEAICGQNAWVSSGYERAVGHWTGNARTETNEEGIVRGALFPYCGQPRVYHCPADRSVCVQTGKRARDRSVSMSTGMNWHDPTQSGPTNGSFAKFSEIILPSPRFASVFIDEAANSIDNNAIGIHGGAATGAAGEINATAGAHKYWNVPASRHNNGAVLSFADGHVEWWKWLDPWVPAANQLPDVSGELAESAPARDIDTSASDRDLQRLKKTVPAGPN